MFWAVKRTCTRRVWYHSSAFCNKAAVTRPVSQHCSARRLLRCMTREKQVRFHEARGERMSEPHEHAFVIAVVLRREREGGAKWCRASYVNSDENKVRAHIYVVGQTVKCSYSKPMADRLCWKHSEVHGFHIKHQIRPWLPREIHGITQQSKSATFGSRLKWNPRTLDQMMGAGSEFSSGYQKEGERMHNSRDTSFHILRTLCSRRSPHPQYLNVMFWTTHLKRLSLRIYFVSVFTYLHINKFHLFAGTCLNDAWI